MRCEFAFADFRNCIGFNILQKRSFSCQKVRTLMLGAAAAAACRAAPILSCHTAFAEPPQQQVEQAVSSTQLQQLCRSGTCR